MRTIGRHRTGERNDYPMECYYCGVLWPVSQLREDGDGNLYCPDEGEIQSLSEQERDAWQS